MKRKKMRELAWKRMHERLNSTAAGRHCGEDGQDFDWYDRLDEVEHRIETKNDMERVIFTEDNSAVVILHSGWDFGIHEDKLDDRTIRWHVKQDHAWGSCDDDPRFVWPNCVADLSYVHALPK